jgi:ribosomal protein L11 methyltransferase
MYLLRFTCESSQVDLLSGELWEAGTLGIREVAGSNGFTTLEAAFQVSGARDQLLEQFGSLQPTWRRLPDRDWVQDTQQAWPGRAIGRRLFLAAPWCPDLTPAGRVRITHSPGLACGTGEHPCTQLALEALEIVTSPGVSVIDVGTGSGLLVIAALKLGAAIAIGLDIDLGALFVASENFALNGFNPNLVAGSTDCLMAGAADVIVANINASVLLSLADDLLSALKPGGTLVLTGFPEEESRVVEAMFPPWSIATREGWSCITYQPSSDASALSS